MMIIHESLRAALAAEGLAIVPIALTDAMRERMAHIADGPVRTYDEYWAEMLEAALIMPTHGQAEQYARDVHSDQEGNLRAGPADGQSVSEEGK